jgi:hypothetical protein
MNHTHQIHRLGAACCKLFSNNKRRIVLFPLLVLFVSSTFAQASQEAKVQAAILYTIVKYFEWPNKGEAGEIEIAVLGNDDVFDALKANYDGKPVGNKKCVIRKVGGSSELSPNSVIYIGKSKSKEFDIIKNVAANKSLLTVTEKEELGMKGSCVNFVIVDGKLKFELNRTATTSSNLKVSGALVSMAILI